MCIRDRSTDCEKGWLAGHLFYSIQWEFYIGTWFLCYICFGQPKYSTPTKNHSTLCRLLLLFCSLYSWSRLDHYWSNVHLRDHRSGCLLKRFIVILNRCTRKRCPRPLKKPKGAANLQSSQKHLISRAYETKLGCVLSFLENANSHVPAHSNSLQTTPDSLHCDLTKCESPFTLATYI